MSDYDKMKQKEIELELKFPGSMRGTPERSERKVGPGSQWKYDLDDPGEIARREAALNVYDMNLPLSYDMKLPLNASQAKKPQASGDSAKKLREAAAKKLLASK